MSEAEKDQFAPKFENKRVIIEATYTKPCLDPDTICTRTEKYMPRKLNLADREPRIPPWRQREIDRKAYEESWWVMDLVVDDVRPVP